MQRYKYYLAFLLCSAFLSIYAIRLAILVEPVLIAPVLETTEEPFTVILDAGHGGEDSGAVGVNGVYEKNLNFQMVEVLSAFLRAGGVAVVETRTEDRLLYTEEQNIRGMRKMYDLKNRLAIAEKYPSALFVSIHMNNFSMSQYQGLQVWYSKNHPQSRAFAESVQSCVRQGLQKENDRVIKAADSSLYLLDRSENPAILIECGFLSSSEECEKLCDRDYQKRLSFFIFCAMMEERSKKTG